MMLCKNTQNTQYKEYSYSIQVLDVLLFMPNSYTYTTYIYIRNETLKKCVCVRSLCLLLQSVQTRFTHTVQR